ncbi:hypothetical protein B296_00037077 [Ensete ventricosum]|uniref:Hexosyltransferase n=1 Tax=Ensete ventricosum TaxID=4639 RepID=A0A427A0J3_ENSVE|nr:hypothetical protein B296_00037077 [Ensete ventricosum]
MFLFVGFAEFLAFVLLQTDAKPGKHDHSIGSNVGETERSCELEFGSYCLWSKEHREVMRDSVVKRLKDQLFVARAYYPSIAKLQGQENLTRELKLNIQDHERILSEAVSDPDLPPHIERKIHKMDQVVAKAKSRSVDCNNVDRKLRQILDLTEDEAHFHMKQSAYLYQLGVQTMSKNETLVRQGLGHDYRVPDDTVKNAAVLHYDGNMKPWLDLGIPKYKKYWKKYLTQEERFMDECNVNP